MARTAREALIQEAATVSISQDEYLKQPATALAEVSYGQQVEVLAADGSLRLVIYPGTIADVPARE